jgi:hypothetical protein
MKVVTPDQNIIDGIKALAEEDSRSFSQYVNIVLPFVLPVFADDPQQRVYVSSALTVSTLVAIAGFAVLAAVGI